MAGEEQKGKGGIMSSRNWKTFLVLLAALLTFAGPTYVVYVFLNMLDMNYFVAMASGFALFVVGLVLIWYLIRRKILS